MKNFIEIVIAFLVLFVFVFSIYSIDFDDIDEYHIKMLVYEILNAYEEEIREYTFLNESEKIEDILEKNLQRGYGVKTLICFEKNYSECFRNLSLQSSNIYSVSYFFASNFSFFDNVELIIYVWKKV